MCRFIDFTGFVLYYLKDKNNPSLNNHLEEIINMLVQNFLEKSAVRNPYKIALVHKHKRLSYAEIDKEANKFANALISFNIKPKERVAIHLPNSVETVISIFGALKASCIFTVLNPSTKIDKLVCILNNCSASVLVTGNNNTHFYEKLKEQVPSLRLVVAATKEFENGRTDQVVSFDALLSENKTQKPSCVTQEHDIASIIYTSGSTGEPKGVVCGHDNMRFAANTIIQYLENSPDDILINVLPLSFDYGLYQLLMAFCFEGTLVLENAFAYPAHILKKIETEKVTGLPGVPTIFSMLLRLDLGKFNLKTLRYVTNTGSTFPPETIATIRKKLPHVKIFSMYGLTECKRALYLPPEMVDKKPNSVGIPITGTEAWIENEDGNRLGPNKTGELILQGPHVMRGYWNNEEETAMWFRPGKNTNNRILRSGDLFKMDEDGYFYFIARKDDIIKCRGEKVSPVEIEKVLYTLDGVVEAAVVGVPDNLLGEAIHAYVVTDHHSLTEKSIKYHCSTFLEDFMIPQRIIFMKSLPKTSSGKIDKKSLIKT